MYHLFPLASAILLFLSFPVYLSGYLSFFALVPLLYVLTKTGKFKKGFLLGLLFGGLYSLLLSYPLFHALIFNYSKSLIHSVLLVTLASIMPYAIISGITTGIYVYLKTENQILTALILPSTWVITDYLREVIPLFLPWGFPGYTLVFTPFIQLADITGIYGITFFIIFMNILITKIITEKKYVRDIPLLAISILLILSYSFIREYQINQLLASENQKNNVRISAIQGNFSTSDRWKNELASLRYSTYIKLTSDILDKSDIILWPETVLNSSDEINLQIINSIRERLKNNQIFIAGATRNDKMNRVYNSVIVADKTNIIDIYDKMILFPYSEVSYSGMSAGNFLSAPAQFEPGKQQRVITTKTANIGITLCFESIYPWFSKRLKNKDADVIFNVANDSWFGKTSEPYLHLYANIARAVELRIPVVRSTNNGISAMIDQTGKLIQKTGLDTRIVLNGNFLKNKIYSFYSKVGDMIVIISAAILLAALIKKQLIVPA